MKFFYLASLALLAGLLSAAPTDAAGIAITGFNYSGSGCPPTGNGSVGSFFSAAGSVYTLIFDKFSASVIAGTGATDTEFCNVTFALTYSNDSSSTVLFQIYRGYAFLAPGVTASLSASYYLAGLPVRRFFTTSAENSFVGPVSEDYLADDFNVTLSTQTLSPNGGTTSLSIITSISICNVANPDGSGLFTVDSQDGVLTST